MPYEDKGVDVKSIMNKLSVGMSGKTVEQNFADKTCPTCGGDATYFKDELSEREYLISGLCQKCQDAVFNDPNCGMERGEE